MALVDGELPAADLPEVIHELDRNPPLLRWTQSMQNISRRRIAGAYARTLEEKVPQSLVDLVMHAPMGETRREPASLQSYGAALVDRLRQKYRVPGWSVAAGPAFASALAIAATWLLMPASNASPTLMTAQLEDALERTVSGSNTTLAGFTPEVTYWSNDQSGWCRQFEMKTSAERAFAIACRSDGGHWRVVVQTPPRPIDATTTVVDPRLPLSGYIAASQNGPALAPAQIENAIKSGWEPPPN
jgi:anti-sigma factor RsiW